MTRRRKLELPAAPEVEVLATGERPDGARWRRLFERQALARLAAAHEGVIPASDRFPLVFEGPDGRPTDLPEPSAEDRERLAALAEAGGWPWHFPHPETLHEFRTRTADGAPALPAEPAVLHLSGPQPVRARHLASDIHGLRRELAARGGAGRPDPVGARSRSRRGRREGRPRGPQGRRARAKADVGREVAELRARIERGKTLAAAAIATVRPRCASVAQEDRAAAALARACRRNTAHRQRVARPGSRPNQK